jgi:hypothetical protein
MKRNKKGHGIIAISHALGMLWLLSLGMLAVNASAADLKSADISTSSANPLAVTIVSTRNSLIAGQAVGITAELKNTSEKMNITVKEADLRLVLPLELEGARGEFVSRPAFFPTEQHNYSAASENEFYTASVTLKPGDTYTAYWSESWQKQGVSYLASQLRTPFQYLFFSPGVYRISIIGRYNVTGESASAIRVATNNISLPVEVPELVLVFGAIIGGFVSYFLFIRARIKKRASKMLVRILIELSGMLGAILTAAVITVLLSRLSATDFIVKVTANDFWGAIVIGIAANYGGAKVLKSLLPREDAGHAEAGKPTSILQQSQSKKVGITNR